MLNSIIRKNIEQKLISFVNLFIWTKFEFEIYSDNIFYIIYQILYYIVEVFQENFLLVFFSLKEKLTNNLYF